MTNFLPTNSKIRSKQCWPILLLALLLVLCLVYGSSGGGVVFAGNPPGQPQAGNGIIDLTGRDWDKSGTVNLDGYWEFYWSQLLEPEDFQGREKPEKSGLIPVPGTWNRFQVDGANAGGDGYATYRLTLKTGVHDNLLGIKLPRIFTAYKLWVDDELLASAGEVGTSRESMTPQYLPQVAIFEPAGESTELIIQTSNFYHRSGGILESIEIGDQKKIRDIREISIAGELFIAGALLIMGIYHLALFLFRKKEISSLIFSLYSLTIATRTVLVGEIFFIHLVSGFNWEVAHNLSTLAYYLGVPLFVMFLRSLFPQEVTLRVVRLTQLVGLTFALLVVLTPAKVFTLFNPAYQLFTMLILPYLIYVVISAIRHKRQGAKIIGIGAIIVVITTLNDIIFLSVILNDYEVPLLRSIVTSGNMSSWGLLTFVFAQSIVLAMNFSQAFTRVEEVSSELHDLNISLEQKVKSRTANLEKTNRELENANQELHKMESFRRDFLANISHDLRSPMTSIKGYVDAILDGIVKEPEEQQKYLQIVQQKTIRLDQLTRELFELARLESREVELNPVPIKAEEFMDNIYNKYVLDLEKQGLDLQVKHPPSFSPQANIDSPTVDVDMEKIEKAFNNLIGNAAHHTSASGRITIGYEVEEEKVLFFVEDTGTGIDQADMPHIFDRFYQGKYSHKDQTDRSGLGLAITREIIEYHGGRIWAENNSGPGTTFYFTLA